MHPRVEVETWERQYDSPGSSGLIMKYIFVSFYEMIVMIKTSLLRVFCKQRARVSNHVFNGCDVRVMDKYVLAAGS